MSPELLDKILDAEEGSANPADRLAVHVAINEARRKRAHARAKAAQPPVPSLSIERPCYAVIVSELRKPFTPEEVATCNEGHDELCKTIIDCAEAGDLGDLLFAMIRLFRKSYCSNRHLDPIEGKKP